MACVFKDITTGSIKTVWNRTPHQFELDVVSHVIKMRCNDYSLKACLLVQGTGGGKSAACQGIGSVDAGKHAKNPSFIKSSFK